MPSDDTALEGVFGIQNPSRCRGLVLETELGTVMLRDGFHDRVTLIPRDRPNCGCRFSVLATRSTRWLDPAQRMLRDFVDSSSARRAPEVDGAQA
jgi:hypothetical protein